LYLIFFIYIFLIFFLLLIKKKKKIEIFFYRIKKKNMSWFFCNACNETDDSRASQIESVPLSRHDQDKYEIERPEPKQIKHTSSSAPAPNSQSAHLDADDSPASVRGPVYELSGGGVTNSPLRRPVDKYDAAKVESEQRSPMSPPQIHQPKLPQLPLKSLNASVDGSEGFSQDFGLSPLYGASPVHAAAPEVEVQNLEEYCASPVHSASPEAAVQNLEENLGGGGGVEEKERTGENSPNRLVLSAANEIAVEDFGISDDGVTEKSDEPENRTILELPNLAWNLAPTRSEQLEVAARATEQIPDSRELAPREPEKQKEKEIDTSKDEEKIQAFLKKHKFDHIHQMKVPKKGGCGCGGGGAKEFSATPLHKAIELNDQEMVEILIRNGADATQRNADKQTAAERAHEMGMSQNLVQNLASAFPTMPVNANQSMNQSMM